MDAISIDISKSALQPRTQILNHLKSCCCYDNLPYLNSDIRDICLANVIALSTDIIIIII